MFSADPMFSGREICGLVAVQPPPGQQRVEIAAEAARLERFASDHATQGVIEIHPLLPRITITTQVQRLEVVLGNLFVKRLQAHTFVHAPPGWVCPNVATDSSVQAMAAATERLCQEILVMINS